MAGNDGVETVEGTDITYFTRLSQPNYKVRHPGEANVDPKAENGVRERDGTTWFTRLSTPNYDPQPPGERQRNNPSFLSSVPVEAFSTIEKAPNADAFDTAGDAADAAGDVGGGLLANKGLITTLIIGAVGLYLLQPILEIGANVSEEG